MDDISIYPKIGAGPQRFVIFENNAQEWECIFTFRLNTAKDIDYIKK